MTSMFRHAFFCAVTLLLVSSAVANNNLFLPGDAFFPTSITKTDLDRMHNQPAGKKQLIYSPLGGYDGAFCGYAGFDKVVIPAVDDAFAERLTTVVKSQLKTAKKSDGIGVLFYPKGFAFPKHKLGLRYNENWAEEAVRFGHPKEHLRLCCLIDDSKAVIESWRDAKDVAPLEAIFPPGAPRNAATRELPVIKGDVKAIVIGEQSLKDIFQRSADRFVLTVIDGAGVSRIEYSNGRWGEPIKAE